MIDPQPMSQALPYTDTKPVGHADFYFAVNATFRFILKRFGYEKLREYWQDIGTSYYKPVSEQWRDHGFAGVAEYWRVFFKAEPGAEVAVHESADEVRLEVQRCPAIHHLHENKREIVPCFCQHCFFVNEAIAAPAGMTVRVQGGNGSCVQRFMKRTAELPPQSLEDIATAS
ncbi:hypothetical protein [Prosthecobacter sp.]|uniref:hypothetical protein n=1 Tax=Prosthecobacter sp. TaxID=1965333 RepID=UPI002ABABB40|nr:hypothetical protein [Prosthecobacter sp.]MDZ4402659.1 hypothetical protein [Prosthecobacter sp.]